MLHVVAKYSPEGASKSRIIIASKQTYSSKHALERFELLERNGLIKRLQRKTLPGEE